MATAVAVPRDGDLDDVRREQSEVMPPCRGKTTGSRALAMPPHRRTNAGRVGELAVVDEVDTPSTSTPVPGPHPALNRFMSEPGALRLGKRDDAILIAK